jgi:glycosyltransferase involved in cell wall biosynthesis
VAAAALAAGLSVIATRVGGLAEQLADAAQAVLCEPDAGSLAGAIRQWLEQPSRVASPPDAANAWRQAVSSLLPAIGTDLKPKTRPSPRGRGAGLGAPLAGGRMPANSRMRRQ